MNTNLIERLRCFEQDHAPHGWPAIQMRDVTALLDTIDAKAKQIEELQEQFAKAVTAWKADETTSEEIIAALRAVSNEYNDWILFHAGGGDYDTFLKHVLAARKGNV